MQFCTWWLPTDYHPPPQTHTIWLRFLFKHYVWIRFVCKCTPLGATLDNNFMRGANRGTLLGIGGPLKKS